MGPTLQPYTPAPPHTQILPFHRPQHVAARSFSPDFGDDDLADCCDESFLEDLERSEADAVARKREFGNGSHGGPTAQRKRLSFADERTMMNNPRAVVDLTAADSPPTPDPLPPPPYAAVRGDAPQFDGGVTGFHIAAPPRPPPPATMPAATIPAWVNPNAALFVTPAPPCASGGGGMEPWLAEMLRPHQREGVAFLHKALVDGSRSQTGRSYVCFGAVLADHMGLGKTLTSLALLYSMVQSGLVGGRAGRKALLIAPPSLLGQWSSEIKKFFGTKLPHLVASNGVYGKKAIHALQDFKSSRSVLLLTSYDFAIRDEAIALLRALPLELLICDEGQRLKNPKAKAFSLLNSLECKRRLVLTGTPVQNNLWEFYALISFIGAAPVVGNKTQFATGFVKPIERAQAENAGRADKAFADQRLTELRRALAPMMLRRTAEVNKDSLPPLIQLAVCCSLTPVQADLYAFFMRSRTVRDAKGAASRSRSDAAFAAIKLLQKTCAHPFSVYFDHNDHVAEAATAAAVARTVAASKRISIDLGSSSDDSDDGAAQGAAGGQSGGAPPAGAGAAAPRAAAAPSTSVAWPEGFDPQIATSLWVWSGKMLVLREMLYSFRAHGEKVVVASTFTTVLDLIEEMVGQMRWPCVRLDGKVLPAKRSEMVEEFNQPTSHNFIFLLSTKAGGSGLNLVGASRLVLMEPDWNPATDKQVCGRVWRPGQKAKSVHTYRLLSACTLEERIYARQLKKIEVERGMFDSGADAASASASSHAAIGDGSYLDEIFEPSTSVWSDVFEQMGDTQTTTVEHLPDALLEGAVTLDGGRWITHIHQIVE